MRSPRSAAGLRPLTMEPAYLKYPEGSCYVRMGDTWVLCTATVEEKVPPFLTGKGKGWVTAEYSMLPRATDVRTRRESTSGRPNGRSQEIQRLIGRALRACVDTKALGERTLTIDCDVLQADGGTRTTAINGAFVALALAIRKLQERGTIATSPIKSAVAAVSVGIVNGELRVDLDYREDSGCDVDMNVVMLEGERIVELQGTAEKEPFSPKDAERMLAAASKAVQEIFAIQRDTLA